MALTAPAAAGDLDAVRRLRVLAACVTGTTYAEALVSAPIDEVWAVAGDLEGELHHLLPDVKSFRILSIDGDRLSALAKGYFGQRARFDVVLRPGWCWMQSRFLVGGLAAVSESGGTRFAFVGGFRFRALGPLDPLVQRAGQPFGRAVIRRLERRLAAASNRLDVPAGDPIGCSHHSRRRDGWEAER